MDCFGGPALLGEAVEVVTPGRGFADGVCAGTGCGGRVARLHDRVKATTAGRAIRVCSTSCNSSASRTSGQASSRTWAIAPDQACRLPPAPTPAESAASPRRAPAVLRAARRQDRRRDWHSESRARTAMARAYPPPHSGFGPPRSHAVSSFSPSRSIASVSTSFITSLTRGWSGI